MHWILILLICTAAIQGDASPRPSGVSQQTRAKEKQTYSSRDPKKPSSYRDDDDDDDDDLPSHHTNHSESSNVAQGHAPSAPQETKDSYGNETMESLEAFGAIKLNGTTIAKSLKITGNLVASSAILNEINATGNVRLVDSTVAKKIQVTGSLSAWNTTFEQPLSFLGQKAVFSRCQLPGITIQKDAAFRGQRIVELKDKTIVDGPIHFVGGGGKVILYSGSKIFGSVSGAQIIKKG